MAFGGRAPRKNMSYWLQCIHQWYPNLHTETYFLPPLHFNRVQYDRQEVGGQQVLVPHKAESGAIHSSLPASPKFSVSKHCNTPAGNPRSPRLPRVQDNDVRDDKAQRRVLRGLRALVDELKEVMIVVSQLKFGSYLNKPSFAAAASLLPRPITMDAEHRQGDFDVLIIHSKHGLIAGEIKSVGDNFARLQLTQEEEDIIVERSVQKALSQLTKSEEVLRHLVSDLPSVNIIKALMLPNITRCQLLRVVNRYLTVGKDLCSCLETTTNDEAVRLCLCTDELSSLDSCFEFPGAPLTELCVWWQNNMAVDRKRSHDVTRSVSGEIYEQLVARFCGPATTVEVYCATSPRLEIRTTGEGVALSGNRMTQLCLYPEQVDIMHRASHRVFLSGPPGTGKTLMLYLKGMQWLKGGNHVHIVNTSPYSRAASYLLQHQLLQVERIESAADHPSVHLHFFGFKNSDDVESAVQQLKAVSRDGQLYVLVDEVGYMFKDFCTQLVSQIPEVCLWAASVYNNNVPECLTEEKVTVSLRSPPVVMQEIERDWLMGREVSKYSATCVPAPTDGPAIRRLRHNNAPGHTDGGADECEQCGRELAGVLRDLGVGVVCSPPHHRGHPLCPSTPSQCNSGLLLQHRDVLVLCDDPRDDRRDSCGHVTSSCSGLVRGLRACDVPVCVVEDRACDADIRDMALCARDEVTVTNLMNVKGLERKVVVTKKRADYKYYTLHAASRCTSQLVIIECESSIGQAKHVSSS